ncbi:hypothetical protein [Candidatus Nitrosocosmicus sp. T]
MILEIQSHPVGLILIISIIKAHMMDLPINKKIGCGNTICYDKRS